MQVDVRAEFTLVFGVRTDRLVVRRVDRFERVCIKQVKIRGEKSSPTAEPILARFAVAIPAVWIVSVMMDVFCDVDGAVARKFLEYSLDSVCR